MGPNKFIPPKCDVCGKFIGWMDFIMDRVITDFTPDTEYTVEETIFTHRKCLK